jgi:hypothetical protein
MCTLILLLMSLNPTSDVIRDEVDIIEINHFYGEDCSPMHDAILFWEYEWYGKKRIVDWRIIRDHRIRMTEQEWSDFCGEWRKITGGNPPDDFFNPSVRTKYVCKDLVPRKTVDGYYVLTWMDGCLLRQVIAKAFYETWTQVDAEQVDAQIYPHNTRRKLGYTFRPIKHVDFQQVQ